MSTRRIQLNPYLQHLRELDFVRAVEFSPEFKIGDRMSGGILSIGSANGAFRFIVEQKNTYLDRGMINAVIAQAKAYEAARSGKRHSPLLLFARYVPRPSAERLLESGVNFLDLAGNMHIVLGSSYERTIIGRREPEAAEQTRTITAAKTQLLFTFAGFPEASRWTVRQLAERAGVSKSNAAKLRKQLVDEGILTRDLRIRNNEDLDGLLLRAYEQALRPKLLINRFRAPANSAEAVIKEMGDVFGRSSTRWSLTGGPAAYELEHFYRGIEVPIFVESLTGAAVRGLRLLPDRDGPLIFLRAFGEAPYWKEIEGKPIAHPWLIYSELMHSSDPRAHEAAEQLKAEFLKQ